MYIDICTPLQDIMDFLLTTIAIFILWMAIGALYSLYGELFEIKKTLHKNKKEIKQ